MTFAFFYKLPLALASGEDCQSLRGFSRIQINNIPFGLSLNFAKAQRLIDYLFPIRLKPLVYWQTCPLAKAVDLKNKCQQSLNKHSQV